MFEERYGLSLLPAIIFAVLASTPIFIISGFTGQFFGIPGRQPYRCCQSDCSLRYYFCRCVYPSWGHWCAANYWLIQPVVLFLFIALSRFAARFWLGGMYIEQLRQGNKPRALIYGAGDAGRELAAALSHSHVTNVIGFLDDDPKLHGSQVRGLPVYDPSDIAMIASKKRVVIVMLALPRISRRRRGEILQSLRGQNVVVRTLPSYSDLAEGRVTVSDIRELSISDILGRDTVAPDQP